MITFRFLIWLLMLVLSIVANHFKRRIFPHILIIFLLMIPIMSLIFLIFLKRNIKTELKSKNEIISKGDIGEWSLNIFNTDKFQSAVVLFKQLSLRTITIFLNPKEMFNQELTRPSTHIGLLNPPEYEAKLLDGFRLFKTSLQPTKQDPVLVIPRINQESIQLNSADRLTSSIQSALIASRVKTEDLELLRPLEPGDSMKKIHWKLSARLGEWFVRTDKSGPVPIVEFIVYPKKEPTNLERRDDFLETSLGYMTYLLNKNIPFKFQSLHFSNYEQIYSSQIALAKIELNHTLSLSPSETLSIPVFFIEELTEEIIFELSLLTQPLILYLFEKEVDPALMNLARFHQLEFIIDETV